LASADSLADAIREAGYTPVQVQASAVVTSKKSCCGHCH